MDDIRTPEQEIRDLKQAMAAAQVAGDRVAISEHSVRLAQLLPESHIHLRQAAYALMANGELERAHEFATAARALAPEDYQIQQLAGRIALLQGDAASAMTELAPLLEHPDRDAELYHLASRAARELDDPALAIELAREAAQRQPEVPARALHLLGLLAQFGHLDEAAALADRLQSDADVAALAMQRISVELIRAGNPTEAITRLDAALATAADDPELLLQKAIALRHLKKLDQAQTLLQDILARQPNNLRARQILVGVYRETGQTAAAMQLAASLLADAPDVPQYKRNLQNILSAPEHLDAPLQDDLPDIATLKTGFTQRKPRPRRTFMGAMQRKLQIFFALFMREIRTRYGRNRLSFVWALLEPLAHVAVLAVVFWVTLRREPPLGDSFLLFYFTGVQSFLLFSKIGGQGGSAVAGGRGVLQLAVITPMDLIAAKAAIELFVTGFVVVVFGGILIVLSGVGLPPRPGYLLPAMAYSIGLGIGFAGLNAVLREVSHIFAILNTGVLRALYFTSGVFFLPGAMPEQVRDIMLWNPLAHISDLWRLAYYPLYNAPFLDVLYAGIFALFFALFGICLVVLATPKLRALK